jgi:hypothetical protein
VVGATGPHDHATAVMRIQVSHPELVPELLEFLQREVHVIVEQVGPRELEVSQLGSMNAEARRLDLDLLLQAWRASHPQATVEIVD